MPSLADLANNLSNFQYYSGLGNFNANSLPASDGQLIVKEPGQKWSLGLSDTLTPFGAVTTVNRTLADVKRVTKFLFTTPQGPQFLIKQTGLQFSNPYLEHDGEALPTDKPTKGQGFFGNVGNSISNFANKISNDYGPTRIYNPLGLSTLAEVGLVAAGVRLNKHGLLPGNTDTNDYINYILKKDGIGSNRLYKLGLRLSKSSDELVIDQYKGGAGSSYGIGTTTIHKAVDKGRSNAMYDFYDPTSRAIGFPIQNLMLLSGSHGSYEASAPKKRTPQMTLPELRKQIFGYKYDFREDKNYIIEDQGKTDAIKLASSNYTKLNVEDRIGVGRARKSNEYNPSYAVDAPLASDHINKISLFYSDAVRGEVLSKFTDVNGIEVGKTADMIKFRIKSFDNDSANGAGVYMIFRAYLNNIKRGIQSKWSPYNYVGRGESFYLYDGFTESITFQFTIMASSRSEMKPLYQKLNYLISTLTPDYNKQNRMRGNISELTIGDFIKYQPGVITSLDIIVDEDSNWDIALEENSTDDNGTIIPGRDGDMHELPHMLKCNMTFIPIYNFLPRKSAEAPFIGIDDSESKNAGKEWTKANSVGLDSILKSQATDLQKSNK